MRTTVTIDDRLLERAKQLALAQHRTLGSIVEDGLRRLVDDSTARTAARKRTRLKTFCGNGVLPGVDLDSNAALNDLMEGR